MADGVYGGVLSPMLKRARLRQAARYLRPGDRIVDLGCGDGDLAAAVAGPIVYTGVDVDHDVLEAGRTRFPEHRFVSHDILSGPPEDVGPADALVMLAILEHVPDPAAVVAAWAEVLVPGGRLVATTPAPASRRVHDAGAAVGIFSGGAAEEHETFLGRADLEAIAGDDLHLVRYKRFQGGLNQTVVFKRR